MPGEIRRRTVLAGLASVLLVRPARATPEAMREAMMQTLGPITPRPGKVKLTVPPLVENGNAVPITVAVDSPMTDADHVTAIHVFNEKNPQPYVISAFLGPQAGRAQFSTRIKLAGAQKIIAVAVMSDGSLWSDSADVIVTLAACVEDVP